MILMSKKIVMDTDIISSNFKDIAKYSHTDTDVKLLKNIPNLKKLTKNIPTIEILKKLYIEKNYPLDFIENIKDKMLKMGRLLPAESMYDLLKKVDCLRDEDLRK